jgi:hypothetical protein
VCHVALISFAAFAVLQSSKNAEAGTSYMIVNEKKWPDLALIHRFVVLLIVRSNSEASTWLIRSPVSVQWMRRCTGKKFAFEMTLRPSYDLKENTRQTYLFHLGAYLSIVTVFQQASPARFLPFMLVRASAPVMHEHLQRTTRKLMHYAPKVPPQSSQNQLAASVPDGWKR